VLTTVHTCDHGLGIEVPYVNKFGFVDQVRQMIALAIGVDNPKRDVVVLSPSEPFNLCFRVLRSS
jgi:hypothetical protein